MVPPKASQRQSGIHLAASPRLSSFPRGFSSSGLDNGESLSRQLSKSSTLVPSITPQNSSTMSFQGAMGSRPPGGQRLRSQYPVDSLENHVEFILVASFDIDRGSIMEHQYPGPISGDEHMLAELMLPEGTHNRSQDWTIFFLHKDTSQDEGDEGSTIAESRPQTARLVDEGDDTKRNDTTPESVSGTASESSVEDEYDEEDAAEPPPLVYVLNLVNTKHDANVKRGAVVKAMAICTRHPFLHIYKPLLLLALEEYFRNPVRETLAALYDSVNAMDLSLMPRLSLLERIILQASPGKDLFYEKFTAMAEMSERQKLISKQTTMRDTHEFESKIVYNGMSIPVKIPTAQSAEMVGDFSIIQLIQTFSGPHSSSPQPFALHPHLTTGGAYTHPIIVLVNAMITQKRIMFLGHNRPSGEVAEAVLAACALASGGLLRGFTRHAFPYTDLTKIDDLLKVPGFVAGVTNPAFANKPEWWDLLCDLPSGRMKISSKIEPAPTTEGIMSFQQQNPSLVNSAQTHEYTGDAAFMDSIQRNITNRLGEGVIRSMWRDWIVKLTRIAAAFEETVYGASALYIGGDRADAGDYGLSGHGYVWSDDTSSKRELAGNLHRIEAWRNTRSYFCFKQDLIYLWNSRPIRSVDLHHHHDRLRTQKLHVDDSAAIYLGFSAMVQGDVEVCQLLTVTPESHGGLFYLSLGLLHPRRDVRYKTVELLDRVMRHEAGKHFWEALGRFAKLAFFRLKREMEAHKDELKDISRTNLMGQNIIEAT